MQLDIIDVKYDITFDDAKNLAIITPILTIASDIAQSIACNVLIDGHELLPTARITVKEKQPTTYTLKSLKVFNPAIHRDEDADDVNCYELHLILFTGATKDMIRDNIQTIYIHQ